MQRRSPTPGKKNAHRIKSIALLQRTPPPSTSRHHTDQDINSHNTHSSLLDQEKEAQLIKTVDKMQGEIDRLDDCLKVKEDKEAYLSMRLNQMTDKQDREMERLRDKLQQLETQAREKDYFILGLKDQLEKISMCQYPAGGGVKQSKSRSLETTAATKARCFSLSISKDNIPLLEPTHNLLSPFNAKFHYD